MESENKQYSVIISEKASQMLVSHARFLAQVGEFTAGQLIASFNEKAHSLNKFPERNPWLIDPLIPTEKYRKLMIYKRYMLIYQIKEDIVYIDALVDTRQDYGWLL